MVWTYWNWVVCSILIGAGIVLFIYLIMAILLWHFHQVFYILVGKLFNIKRCIVDVNNKIVRKNNEIFILPAKAKRAAGSILKVWRWFKERFGTVPNEDETSSTGSVQHPSNQNDLDQEENSVGDLAEKDGATWCCWPGRVGVSDPTEVSSARARPQITSSSSSSKQKEVSLNHPAHPEHQREVLDVYGRFLTLNKKRNKFLIMTLIVIVISSVIIAGFQGCFLANITVYVDSPCPFYGVMDCYYGPDATYFQCTSGATISFPSGIYSGACFRWIGHDTTVSDVMTQIGACTGLLTAFGSVVEVLLRLLFFVFQQRPSVATGIRRLMEKTVGINKTTQPYRCCGTKLPCHFGVLNLSLYQRPWLVLIFFLFYILLPMCAFASIGVMSSLRISITALTYIVLISVVLICLLGLLWVLWEEDEIGRVLPGAWVSAAAIAGIVNGGIKKWTPLLHGVIPEEDLKNLNNFRDGVLHDLNAHANMILDQLNGHTKEIVEKLARSIENKLPVSEGQELVRFTEGVRSKTKVFIKQLQGTAEDIRERKDVEKSKDLGGAVSRKS